MFNQIVGNFFSYTSLLEICIQTNIVISISTLFINAIILLISSTQKNNILPTLLKLWLPLSFFIGLFLQLLALYAFISDSTWELLSNEYICVNSISTLFSSKYGYISIDLFGITLVLLAYIVGFLSLLNLTDKVFWSSLNQTLLFNYFIVVVMLFVCCDDIYIFFILYELLLLPSLVLVYYNSPNKKGIQAALYFLIWTQLGSLLVFLAITRISTASGLTMIHQLRAITFSESDIIYIKLLLFFGFGFKIPIWPFHYWLTKTHVEAPGSFSMYLSGFLVKTALFGLYKLFLVLNFPTNNIFLLVIASIGVVDASLKMWAQIDLKKLVAFCTIQEMNLIVMCFLFGYSSIVSVGILFCFMHALLSTLMFFLVDCIQRRFQSRQTAEVIGIIHITPNLGLASIAMVLMYLAIPGTLKFSCEFMLFCYLADTSFFIFFIILISASTIAPIAFAKLWYGCIFGTPTHNMQTNNDLTHKELVIILICLILLILLSALSYSFF